MFKIVMFNFKIRTAWIAQQWKIYSITNFTQSNNTKFYAFSCFQNKMVSKCLIQYYLLIGLISMPFTIGISCWYILKNKELVKNHTTYIFPIAETGLYRTTVTFYYTNIIFMCLWANIWSNVCSLSVKDFI